MRYIASASYACGAGYVHSFNTLKKAKEYLQTIQDRHGSHCFCLCEAISRYKNKADKSPVTVHQKAFYV